MKIIIKNNYDREKAFNEDSTIGAERVGRLISRLLPSDEIEVSSSATELMKIAGIKWTLSTDSVWNIDDLWMEFEENPDIKYERFSGYYNLIRNQNSRARQGLSRRNFEEQKSTDVLPYVTVNCNNPYPDHTVKKFQPVFDEQTVIGIKEEINREKFIPFSEINTFDQATYLDNASNNFLSVPGINDNNRYNDNLGMNGAIEALDIRTKGINSLLPLRGYYYGIGCSLMAGGIDENMKGDAFITDYKHVKQGLRGDFFEDSQSLTHGQESLPDNTLLSPYHHKRTDYPFDDAKRTDIISSDSYGFMSDSQIITLTSDSFRDVSEIGTRYVATNRGFVYDSPVLGNNKLGTDSLAFGGLKR